MKKISFFLCLVTMIIAYYSCSNNEDPIGAWDDNIKLSIKTVEFNADVDSVIITTEGDWWWITDVTVNNDVFYMSQDVDPDSVNYSFQQSCFVVERRDKNTIFIKVEKNMLFAQRIIIVGLEAGDYFDRITITQAAQ